MGEKVEGYLELDEIQARVRISEGKAKQLKEACIWALWFCGHSNGVRLSVVEAGASASYPINWAEDQLDAEAVRRSYNQDDATEYGAEALALLLAIQRTEYDAVERSVTSSGIDYWLGFKDGNSAQPFQRASRLEISGIMKETAGNRVSARVKQKLEKANLSAHSFPVYVTVVEFGQPYALLALRK